MRILIHDFAGHAFQVALSRALASRGHEVVHAFFAEDPGPKGGMFNFQSEAGRVEMLPISIGRPYSKGNFLQRFRDDLVYRSVFRRKLADIDCDVIISSNTPTWIQGAVVGYCLGSNTKFVYWCQDFYSIAVESVFTQKIGIVGRGIGAVLKWLDRRHMRSSDYVLHITERFKRVTDTWGLDEAQVGVIPNWGAIADIPLLPTDNQWAEERLTSRHKRHVIYSGTLGLKHDPSLIEQASLACPDLEFVVVGSGVGFDKLDVSIENLQKLPLQPFERLPEVLAAAHILIAMIEPDAGEFSVPSKVLSYLCAGRPIVLSAPASNLAAAIVREAGAGLVVEPGDAKGFSSAIKEISDNSELAARMARDGRKYAEENFEIENVADRFELLFNQVVN